MTSTIPTSTPPAGWYPDPSHSGQQRYWDGQQWAAPQAPVATQPQAGYAYPTAGFPAAAKKPFWKRGWFITLAVIVVLIAVISAMNSGSTPAAHAGHHHKAAAGKAAHHGVKAPSAKPSAAPASPAPGPDATTATKNGPLTWGNWQAVGPVVPHSAFGTYDLNMRVKNTESTADQGFFTVTVLKGKRILTTFDCDTKNVQPGEIANATCVSFDNYTAGWTAITVEDTF